MEHTGESIDLGKLWQIIKDRRKQAVGIIVGCTLGAIIAALVLPPTYESTTIVQTRAADKSLSAVSAITDLGLGSTSSSTMNYVELMKTRAVLDPIIEELDWDADDKEFLTADKFAKKNLSIENRKQTNLISVTAKGKTPEEAQMISQHVVDNFLVLMTNMNQETQSLLVKFLSNRIDEAKEEAEEANQKFANYQKEHKVYSPEDQSKAIVAKMEAFDDAIGKMEVQQKASQAKLDVANEKLEDMKAGSLSYNINDNATVQDIRNKIVDKQVELIGLQQKYTDQHPSVILAENQLAELQQKLTNEVGAVVSSNATSLNPAQAELVKEQALATASIAVAKASETAIKQRQNQKQQELGDFPNEVLEYMNLKRDATIKNEIYVQLVKQCEQSKIQQAKDSMDIQIVDPANLPFAKKPAFPKKSIFALSGLMSGVLISLVNSLWLYKKKYA